MSWFLLRLILQSKSFNSSGRTQFLELRMRSSGIWKMTTITKAKTTPHVFIENLVHLAKSWSRPFLHLMGFLSARGMDQKGSWDRIGHHCHISRQNRNTFCEGWQHTYGEKKENQLLQLLEGYCWECLGAVGLHCWRGGMKRIGDGSCNGGEV